MLQLTIDVLWSEYASEYALARTRDLCVEAIGRHLGVVFPSLDIASLLIEHKVHWPPYFALEGFGVRDWHEVLHYISPASSASELQLCCNLQLISQDWSFFGLEIESYLVPWSPSSYREGHPGK